MGKRGGKKPGSRLQQQILTNKVVQMYEEITVKPGDDLQLCDQIYSMLVDRFKSSFHQSRDQLVPQIDQSL